MTPALALRHLPSYTEGREFRSYVIELGERGARPWQQALRQRAETRLNQLMAQRSSLLQDQEKQARGNDDLALIRAIHRVAPDWECSTIIGALSSAYAECREDPTYLVEITEHGAELLEKEKSD